MRAAPPGVSQDDLDPPRILAIGGSTRPDSTTERALALVAHAAERAGAQVEVIAGRDLLLPIYDTETDERSPGAIHLVESARRADGLIVVSPGYHSSISGLVKNALDYLEDLAADPEPYLHGKAFGAVAVAHGWQASVTTLHHLRQVAHALRGWPTPLGVAVNSSVDDLRSPSDRMKEQLELVGEQVVQFASMVRAQWGRP